MTAFSRELIAPRRGPLAVLSSHAGRAELFTALYILGCANGLLGRIILSLDFNDWTGALLGLDINAIVLFACFAGISGVLSSSRDEVRPADLAVAAIFLVLVSLPIFPLSWVGVT